MTSSHRPRDAPDRGLALAQYRRRAGHYDLELAPFEPIRRRAVETLGLRTGDTVIDVGCGTGLSLPLLEAEVGPRGRIVAIEQSPDMAALAARRIARQGWRNVNLVERPVEEMALPLAADAAILHFTHDILRRPEAVDAVLRHLRPGACVVAAGLKWAPPWAWPVNLFVASAAMYSTSSLDGLDAPWSHLARGLGSLSLETALCGGAYIASGRLAARAP